MSTKGECPEEDFYRSKSNTMVHCEIVKRDSKRFIVMLFKYNLINRSLNYQGSTDYFGCLF